MGFLADTWVLWIIVCAVMLVGMVLYRQSRRNVTMTFSSADDFSVRTIFFNLRRGEADLFLGFLVAMITFSLAVLGIVRWVQIIVQ